MRKKFSNPPDKVYELLFNLELDMSLFGYWIQNDNGSWEGWQTGFPNADVLVVNKDMKDCALAGFADQDLIDEWTGYENWCEIDFAGN